MLALAAKLGIDAKAIVEDTMKNGKRLDSFWEADELELYRYSEKWPGFKGTYEIDLTFASLGVRSTR